MSGRAAGRVLSRAAAVREVAKAKRRGLRVVFTSGCFDLLHVGHLRSLEEARSLGDLLVVGVNADATVRKLKGAGRPIVPARRRAELVAGLHCVHWALIFSGATPRATIAALRPDVFAKGGDWPLAVLRANDLPENFGGVLHRLRQVPGARSSALVQRIRQRAGRRSG
ncbi:MAG: adenylyltransferase/cytidyltransferase family protein [Deltaproteobacteria bacterium]|nr:adenylyltransferase/cytidyltransferase family protein [Deltaproteobacteria bacterium]MDD9826954.1 adenylyltransferase/cytidyltransferase family protein [Deltaproteobacteria bacterium]